MLALIAGRGGLPAVVAAAQAERPLVCALDGHQPDGLAVDHPFRIEHLGTLRDRLVALGVREVCFCGSVTRPVIDASAIDTATAPLVPVLAQAVAGGEDSALRAILGIFESAGFAVRGAHELAPALLTQAGVLTQAQPVAQVAASLPAALDVLADQGATDLGQACVVRGDVVIAREDARGTDAMLADLAGASDAVQPDDFDLANWLAQAGPQARKGATGGYLFKAPKPNQDLRVDLPTIGTWTVVRAAEAGLDGIVIPQGGVMVMDAAQVIAALDAMEMFLWVR